MKISLYCPKSAAIGIFLGTQERVRNSHGKRAISVRASEFLLYILFKTRRQYKNKKNTYKIYKSFYTILYTTNNIIICYESYTTKQLSA